MDTKKILLFLCAISFLNNIYSMESQEPTKVHQRLKRQRKEKTKPNAMLEFLKGGLGLAAATFFAQAIIKHRNIYPSLVGELMDKQSREYPFKDLPSICMARLFKNIAPLLFKGDHLIHQVQILQTTYCMISALGAYICGKYGMTKLYNFFSGKYDQERKNKDMSIFLNKHS